MRSSGQYASSVFWLLAQSNLEVIGGPRVMVLPPQTGFLFLWSTDHKSRSVSERPADLRDAFDEDKFIQPAHRFSCASPHEVAATNPVADLTTMTPLAHLASPSNQDSQWTLSCNSFWSSGARARTIPLGSQLAASFLLARSWLSALVCNSSLVF